ncbi:MAG: Glycine betaine ABC transporter substrate-binding protein [Clostridia bacterium 62_21]|nr:MAG: Glycine betaine ABC transporter substrate-binding protein [Clostridia bacterium 62_21]HAG06865.1 glycine/betaine ABC transporter substrate-binding protein [Peptococcaceae bacterium]
MRKKGMLVLVAVLVLGLLAAGTGCGGGAAEKEVTIAMTPWSTTIPTTNIAKILLEEELGYKVNVQNADAGVTYSGLASGDIDIFLDSWLPHMHADYMKKYGKNIEDIGTVYTEGVLGWVAPTYVEPDSIAELNDYKDKFDSNGNGKGEIIGIEPGAGMMRTSKKIIDAYGLDFELVESSEWAMMAEVDKAVKENRWIVFLGWSPHWMFAKYDLKYLEDPKGFWAGDEVHVLVTKGLEKRAPEVVSFLKKFKVSIDDMNKMIYDIEVEKKDPVAVARAWIDAHPDEVKAMLGE